MDVMDETFYNTEAEQSLIGSVLINADILEHANVSVEDFYIHSNRMIWKACLSLRSRNKPIDYITLSDELNQRKELEEIGGPAYLIGLLNSTPSCAHAPYYAKIVARCAEKRRLLGLASQIANQVVKAKTHEEQENLPGNVLSLVEMTFHANQTSRQERLTWTAKDLCSQTLASPPWLLEGMLTAGGVNLLAGEVASGKTYLALDLALGLTSNGIAWDGRETIKSPVIYYCLDNSQRTIQDRVRTLCQGREIEPPETLILDLSPLNLAQPASFIQIRQAVEKHKAGLVVFDVLARYMPGVDENSVASVGPIMTGLRTLATQTNAAVLILHHFNKGLGYVSQGSQGNRVRGSTDIFGAVDCAVTVTLKGSKPDMQRILTPEKCRDAPEQAPTTFQLVSGEIGGTLLAFGQTELVKPKSSKVTESVNYIVSEMEKSPDASYTRSDIEVILEQANIKCGSRTLDRVFSDLGSFPNIRVAQPGRNKAYCWDAPEAA